MVGEGGGGRWKILTRAGNALVLWWHQYQQFRVQFDSDPVLSAITTTTPTSSSIIAAYELRE
jgi:hypothetical protein